jgi:hypothetical protein
MRMRVRVMDMTRRMRGATAMRRQRGQRQRGGNPTGRGGGISPEAPRVS